MQKVRHEIRARCDPSQHNLGRFPVDNPSRPFFRPTVLTQVVVSCIYIWSGQDRNPDRDSFVVPQPDNRGKGETGVDIDSVILFSNRRAFDQKLDSVLGPRD